ncbi:molybdate ABC transporter substrate-binding protein [Pontiellaceae bacterium B1224]|nr:molybdate ABC transporter substrate-binding protein [Pontiellaceae bacterium B1224]
MKIIATFSFLLFIVQLSSADLAVFAAASTTDAMTELAAAFKADDGDSVQFNFASSGALARQIDSGAPADVFVSANTKWMDWLEEKSVLQKGSRFNLAANTLVLIAPPGSPLKFDGQVDGRVAVGDFKSVPAGLYAQEALDYMGWLNDWKPKLVMASNVRTALLYVQRGEVAAGIVYATDAKAAGLPVVGTFPAESHSPIVYPVAAVSKNKTALKFLEFLRTDMAKVILKKHGFTAPEENIKHKDTKVSKQAGLKKYPSSCPSC